MLKHAFESSSLSGAREISRDDQKSSSVRLGLVYKIVSDHYAPRRHVS